MAAGRLPFGKVWINDHLTTASEMPHGGFKQSGYGNDMSSFRETDGVHAERRSPWACRRNSLRRASLTPTQEVVLEQVLCGDADGRIEPSLS